MKQLTLLFLALSVTAFSQSGRIAGSVVDDSGAPIPGASVTAALWSTTQTLTLVPGKPPAFMPVPANALTGAKGEFQIDGLIAGQYYVCVEKPDAAILNPCLWADPPTPVDVGAAATVSGLVVTASKGIAINVRVQDAKGLLTVNPAADDVWVGTFHRKSPFIPGRIVQRDPAGRTMSVIVPRGQAASIAVSSAAFTVADDKGGALAPEIQIPAAVVAQGNAGPALTVYVTGTKPGH